MTSTPMFYPLLLAALVLVCLIIHVGWPDPLRATPSPPVQPDQPRRKRSKEPKPFAGYLHKPLCEACEHGIDMRPKAPGSPPPVIIFNRGRKRTVDTAGHFCPDPDCAYRGWLGLGNIRANGHPGGQPWRQFQCVSCQRYFYETEGTIFHGKRSSPDLIVHVIACLAEGLGIRGTARVFEIDPNTVLNWLTEAAEQLRTFSAYFLHDLHLHQVQLDELYAILSAVRDGEMSEAEAIDHLSTSPRWVWTALDPESKLMLSAQSGDRSPTIAQAVLHQIAQLLAPGCVPLFLSDKGEAGLDSQLTLFQVYYNFVLPHASLRQALAEPMATHGNGSTKLWQPRTPAMASGLTDHRWSLREVLMFRVPPWPQPQMV